MLRAVPSDQNRSSEKETGLHASKLALLDATHGHRSQGRPAPTYVDVRKRDVGVENAGELARRMEGRDGWRLRRKARLRTTQ